MAAGTNSYFYEGCKNSTAAICPVFGRAPPSVLGLLDLICEREDPNTTLRCSFCTCEYSAKDTKSPYTGKKVHGSCIEELSPARAEAFTKDEIGDPSEAKGTRRFKAIPTGDSHTAPVLEDSAVTCEICLGG